MRAVRPATCTIYGLDADLILLAMLLTVDTGATVQLLREAQEFEREGVAGAWKTVHIGQLIIALLGSTEKVRDFVATMSLLGNDFLPRPLTRTVRDDGIPTLIATLEREVWARGSRIVGADGSLNGSALRALIASWASSEEADMLNAVREAARAATRPPGIGDSPEETALRVWNAAPATWASLTRLQAPDGSQRPDWQTIYRESWHAGDPANYCKGVAWVWDYYSGRTVDQGWIFEEHLPPLWSDLAAVIGEGPILAPPIVYPEPLPEWLHLLSVLPAASVERLLPAKSALIAKAPWYWPSSWSLFDVGRRQIWECEPVIPVIPEPVLRSWALK
jgi:5'-3' exonuclease